MVSLWFKLPFTLPSKFNQKQNIKGPPVYIDIIKERPHLDNLFLFFFTFNLKFFLQKKHKKRGGEKKKQKFWHILISPLSPFLLSNNNQQYVSPQTTTLPPLFSAAMERSRDTPWVQISYSRTLLHSNSTTPRRTVFKPK